MKRIILINILIFAIIFGFISCKKAPSPKEQMLQKIENQIIPQLKEIKKEKENIRNAKASLTADFNAKIEEIEKSLKNLEIKLNEIDETINNLVAKPKPKKLSETKIFKWGLTYVIILIVLLILVFIWIKINKQKKEIESAEEDVWEEIPAPEKSEGVKEEGKTESSDKPVDNSEKDSD